MGRISKQRKEPKWLPFKNLKSESLNIQCAFYVHMLGTYMHIYTKYKVSLRRQRRARDEQSMIV